MDSYAFGRTMAAAWAAISLVATAGGAAAEPPAATAGEGMPQFPVGTVMAKTFSYRHDFRDASLGERLLETRIEMRCDDGWFGASYLWNADQTDAELALSGAAMEVGRIHDDGKPRTTGLDLSWEQESPAQLGVWKSPVAAGHGDGGRKYDIVPGKPDELVLMYRIESHDPSIMMPTIGRSLFQEEAVAVVRAWIKGLPATPQP